jgi:hypothetical protein
MEEIVMKKMLPFIYTMILVIVFSGTSLFAASLVEERRYEPVVLPAYNSAINALEGAKVDQIYLYAWHDASAQWQLMPFQIDEQTFGPDPRNLNINKWFYFIPPLWSEIDSISISEHNGLFDDHDELAFMVPDCGDKAPENTFLEVDGEKLLPKVEVVLTDPLNTDNRAYAYLFTSVIQKQIPSPYEFEYFADADSVTNKYYGFGLSESGAVDDIVIKQPGGSGLDLLDKLKIRFSGILDFAFPITVLVKEHDFYLFPEINVTENPIVRLIRESRITLALGDYLIDELAFPVLTKFYPYSGFIDGGTSLAPEDLRFYYNDVEVLMVVHSIRESWDYNENAVGMKFYNKYNNGILVDGVTDELDKSVDLPVNAWDLTTGDQGSIFKMAQFTEQKWGGVEVYYHDSQKGGQADSLVFNDTEDSGDGMSYGDNGILFKNKPDQDSVTIELNYTIYFLPEKNLTQEYGENFAAIFNNPVAVSKNIISSVKNTPQSLDEFVLQRNYPNPFNASTLIRFSTTMPAFVQLVIYDVQGRIVSNLANDYFDAGSHDVKWSGLSNHGELMPSGVYYCRMEAGDFTDTLKLLMIK